MRQSSTRSIHIIKTITIITMLLKNSEFLKKNIFNALRRKQSTKNYNQK